MLIVKGGGYVSVMHMKVRNTIEMDVRGGPSATRVVGSTGNEGQEFGSGKWRKFLHEGSGAALTRALRPLVTSLDRGVNVTGGLITIK